MQGNERQVSSANQPAVRTLAMPADTNPAGDIFGGWLLAQMDIAGGIVARQRSLGRVATVAIDRMTFLKPVLVGDLVSCYASVERVGNTSMTVRVVTKVTREGNAAELTVTEGNFTYVAIDGNRRPRSVPTETDGH